MPTNQSPSRKPLHQLHSGNSIGTKRALPTGIGRAGRVSRIKPMLRAEIQLASGPTQNLEDQLVADWAEQAGTAR
jgi:hypothetical protein